MSENLENTFIFKVLFYLSVLFYIVMSFVNPFIVYKVIINNYKINQIPDLALKLNLLMIVFVTFTTIMFIEENTQEKKKINSSVIILTGLVFSISVLSLSCIVLPCAVVLLPIIFILTSLGVKI